MKLGLLADIHEDIENLRAALDRLRQDGVDRVVALGDVVAFGQEVNSERVAETVRLLTEIGAVGVWGNHDFGFCCEPVDRIVREYAGPVLEFMGSLQPRLEIDGCLFTHIEPWLDPRNVDDLWYSDGPLDTAHRLARNFDAASNRVMFMGHLHDWRIATPTRVLDWRGNGPIRLADSDRYLVIVDALFKGRFATYDTTTGMLFPRTVDGRCRP